MKAVNPLRVYIDTSVIGGCLDEEFAQASQALVEAMACGLLIGLISETLLSELAEAPKGVKYWLQKVRDCRCEHLPITNEAEALRDQYLKAKVVTIKFADDALHVAHATIVRADVIVSWNFKHLVNPNRIRIFNGVNISQGYGQVIIMTPSDVINMLEKLQ